MRDDRFIRSTGATRRELLAGAAALGAASALPSAAPRAAEIESHGLSTFGDLQLPPGVTTEADPEHMGLLMAGRATQSPEASEAPA